MSGKFRQVRRRAGSGRFRFVSFRAEVVVVMVRGLVGCRFLGSGQVIWSRPSHSHTQSQHFITADSASHIGGLSMISIGGGQAGSCQAKKKNQDGSRLRWWSGIVGVAPDEVPEGRNQGEGDEDDRRIVHGGSHDGHGGRHAEQRNG